MKGRGLKQPWLLAFGAVLLIAGHGFLFYGLSKTALPVALLSGLAILIVIRHLRLLRLLRGRFQRRTRA